MAYLSSFENDIFISYARVDDQKSPGKEKGWVTLFHENLEIELSKRFGRVGIIKIWRDTRELSGNTYFDEAIRNSVNSSGIFLALTSRGYLNPDSYCPRELTEFYQKAQTDKYGVKIGTSSRLFNILLNNIPFDEWPDEFKGTSGLAFHDAQRPEQFGIPSHQDQELFEGQLRQLVDQIEATLKAFKKVSDPAPISSVVPPPNDAFTVFLAHAEGPLRAAKRRVMEELRGSGLQVITDIPPPYPADEHEKRVTAEIKKAKLSVHLLDGAAGMEVQDDPTKSYYQKQVEIGRQHAKTQLIWIPKTLDLQTVEDESHKDFLIQLENGDRDPSTYRLIRESTSSITREVLAQINQMKEKEKSPEPSPSAALVNTHMKDQLYALELGKFLIERQILPLISPEEDDPQKNITHFQETLKRVRILIIIFGQVAGEWVRERLISALQIAIADKCPLKFCGIYMAPISDKSNDRQVSLGMFSASIPVFLFDKPEMLANLLETFVGK